jgi:hypothetical protein
MTAVLTLTPTVARQLAITKQRLAGERAAATREGMMDIMRSIRCLQLDPISAVARSHTLVMWSRARYYSLADLERLIYQDRQLFEFWAHAASIVLTEDYALHEPMMRGYAEDTSGYGERTREWVDQNEALKAFILREITEKGALLSRQLEEDGVHPEAWVSTGWTSGRNVSRMLDYLWIKGIICVANRVGGQKRWDLTERCYPQFASAPRLSPEEMTDTSAQLAIKALGVARNAHIRQHFIRQRYEKLDDALRRLATAKCILPVRIQQEGEPAWSGDWFIHTDDLPLVERLQKGEFHGRTTLLSPFDNLICDRVRTRLMWNFDFTIEIYVPKEKRQYGYYVLPILHGDQLIGRVDSQMNRKQKRLEINTIHAEPSAPLDLSTGKMVRDAIDELATFLGANNISFTERVPKKWSKSLR